VKLAHAIRRVEDPLFGRDTSLDAHVLVVGPGGAVGDQNPTAGETFAE
jgi:hypothetical protein